MERVERVITLQTSKMAELKKKVEDRREEVISEFEQLRLCLQNQQEALLRQRKDEETDILANLSANRVTFSDHASTLKRLLKEVECRCAQSEPELLTHVEGIYHRYEALKRPELFLFRLKKEPSSTVLWLGQNYQGISSRCDSRS